MSEIQYAAVIPEPYRIWLHTPMAFHVWSVNAPLSHSEQLPDGETDLKMSFE